MAIGSMKLPALSSFGRFPGLLQALLGHSQNGEMGHFLRPNFPSFPFYLGWEQPCVLTSIQVAAACVSSAVSHTVFWLEQWKRQKERRKDGRISSGDPLV